MGCRQSPYEESALLRHTGMALAIACCVAAQRSIGYCSAACKLNPDETPTHATLRVKQVIGRIQDMDVTVLAFAQWASYYYY